ncbi:MAG: CHASE domain-containing protein [Anaeromyxobacteraceae bacterium]
MGDLALPGELEAHERAVRATGIPGYRVWPPGPRAVMTSIVHIEPLDWRNQRAVGFDMYSEPVRREAMERARDTGQPAATGRVELVQEAGATRQAGFLVYLPVYRGGDPPETLEERRARLIGWVYAPFRAGDLLAGTLAVADIPGMRLDIHDGQGAEPGTLLAALGEPEAAEPPVRVRVTHVEVGGRTWTLRLSAGPAFAQPAERQLPRIVAAISAAIALLLFWISWREAQARGRAERTALRNAFLADAGRLLAASFDYFRTLDDVVRLAAGQIADGAIVQLVEPAEPLWLVAHRDPAAGRAIASALRGWRPRSEDAVGPLAALRTGAPIVVRRIAWDAPPLAGKPELAGALRAAGVRAALAVPLVARGEPLGAVVLLSSRRLRPFPPESVALGEDLARLVVAAVESARLYRRAQDAVRSRDEFLSIASHELKTPITSLALQADSLRSSATRGDTDALVRKIEVVRRNVRRLSNLVSTMLDLSRIQAGRLDLEPELVDLGELAREVVVRHGEEAERAHVTLRLDAPEPVIGRWDRLRLEQVVTNLVTNALKYGRGHPVDVRARGAGDRAVLEVRDRGIGIALDDQPRIFERFERAVSDRHYGGFGLGLWIVREVVGAMGGQIRLQSAPGEGSTFTVELRRAPDEASPAPAPSRAGPGAA